MRLLHLVVPFLVVGTLLSDVAHFLTAPFRGAAELASHVWHAIRSLFLKLRDVFGHVWDAMQDFYNGIVSFGRAAIHFAQNVVNAIGWLVETAIPAVGRWAWGKAWRFTKALVSDVRKWARSLFIWVKQHAERLVNALHKLVLHVYRILKKPIDWVVHWIRNVGTALWNLVMHPTRLVAWILPHLVIPLLRFIVMHSAPVVRFLFRVALRESLGLVGLVEDTLAKLI